MISFAAAPSLQPQPKHDADKHKQNRVMFRKARLKTATIKEKLRQAKDKRPPITKKALAKLWYKNVRIDDIAMYFGVSDERIRVAAAKYKLDSKAKVQEVFDSEWQPGDPTADEIKERAAEVRRGWSHEEMLRRAGVREAAEHWTIPAFSYNSKRAMFVKANC